MFSGLIILSDLIPTHLNIPMLNHKKIFVSHGTKDPLIPLDRIKKDSERLKHSGADITVKYFDMGHELIEEELNAANRRLMSFNK
ncbi:hypothetical protein ABWW58_11995 [Sporolactobacillus sp. STCC-11]|uniref:alpha/beta hydrolase n=1 Tax=Sporolactobacillus caesalpiniae TaxID=3230362 RepID=UPI00339756E5